MANVKHNGLNPAKVKNLTTPGTYTDGDGLTLRVSATGAKSWVLRLTVHGKRRNVGLGSYPAVGLGEARRLAADNVRAAREGRDPVAEKRAARHETRALASAPDFQTVAAQVIELRRPTWTNATHAKQWEGSLALHVFPVLGEKRIDTITTADVMSVLMPIWTSKPETSSRVKHRMATIFDFAVVQGWRPDNPASSALTRALPRRPRLKQHHQALPYSDVRNALQRVRESAAAPVTRLSFQFLVFTVARAGEVRMATWQEMELDPPPGRFRQSE